MCIRDRSKTYKRFAFYEAMKRLNQTDIRRTVVLTGTRRVGKTTIQYQMIEALLQSGVPPQKIVFISMDHPMLKLSAMNEILECYHENIYPDQDVYYFFDEIQYAQDWDKWLKAIYDMQPDTKMVATGSASPVDVYKRQIGHRSPTARGRACLRKQPSPHRLFFMVWPHGTISQHDSGRNRRRSVCH